MRRPLCIRLLPAFLALGGAPAPAQTPWPGEAAFEFHATSTLKDFSGRVAAEPFVLARTADAGGAWLAGTVTVAVARMDTDHARRDVNMRRMFDEPRFPVLTGVLPPLPVPFDDDTILPLALTIRDRTTVVPARLSGWRAEDDQATFTMEMTLSLQEVGLTPPVFLGVLRVGDAVQVRGQFRLGP